MKSCKRLGIDIGSTTVKVAIIDDSGSILFADYERHFANIQETLALLLKRAVEALGEMELYPVITGSGGLTLSSRLEVPFVQEVVAVASSLQDYAPQTDVAIELGGEDAKIIYFTGGIDQRMNGICAGGTGSFIDQMASLLQTDASGLNEYAKNYKAIYPIAARCGVFAKSDIQPLINEGATREDLAASIFQAVVNQTISGLGLRKADPRKRGFPGRSSSLPLRASGRLYQNSESGAGSDYCSGSLPSVRSCRRGHELPPRSKNGRPGSHPPSV